MTVVTRYRVQRLLHIGHYEEIDILYPGDIGGNFLHHEIFHPFPYEPGYIAVSVIVGSAKGKKQRLAGIGK